jgi:SAM-dependent methyltransferase
MDGYRPESYGENFADVYDDWYDDVSDGAATVAGVAELAEGGPILELGVGTGRLAIPLAARGNEVVGVDASSAMLDRLRAKDGGAAVAVVEADMADPPVAAGHFALAFAAFNTFFNLTDESTQRRCIANVARVLRPGGRLVIEGFVPPAEGLADGGVSVRTITLDRAVLSASKHDPLTQMIHGQHIDISATGIRMRPWVLHYRTPAQLDSLTATAGFALETRHADWTGTPWSDGAENHISVYRLPGSSPAKDPSDTRGSG